MLRMHRGPLRACLASLLASILVSATAEAQDDASRSVPAEFVGDKAPYQLTLDHITGDIEVLNHKGEVQERWIAREQARSGVAPLVSRDIYLERAWTCLHRLVFRACPIYLR